MSESRVPLLAVVVVTYRNRETIAACLDAAHLLPMSYELVVVDHGDDGSAELAGHLGARLLVDAGNPGFGAGQNRGVRVSSAPYLLLLNPDATIEPAAIADGLDVLAARRDVAAVQGTVVGGNGAPERSGGRELGVLHLLGRAAAMRHLLRFGVVRRLALRSAALADHVRRVPEGQRVVESLAATVLLLRREAFDDCGGFDEGYFLYGEDVDLCHRLRLRGWTLLAVPEVWARHRNGLSSGTQWQRELHWWRGTMRFAARWWSPGRWSVAVGAATIMVLRLAAMHPSRSHEAVRACLTDPLRARRTLRPLRRTQAGSTGPVQAHVDRG